MCGQANYCPLQRDLPMTARIKVILATGSHS